MLIELLGVIVILALIFWVIKQLGLPQPVFIVAVVIAVIYLLRRFTGWLL